MYYPKLSPQLVAGVATASVDCGVRATKMALDWISKGKVIRSVKFIREVGAMGNGPTNFDEWDTVIDKLGGRTLGFRGVKTNDWNAIRKHLVKGGAAILAVNYGRYRSMAQSKSGSLTFNGNHAILFVNARKRGNRTQTRSFDSLLDGRYQGCPNGPVWIELNVVRRSAEAVGSVFGVLLVRDDSPDPGVDEPPEGGDASTLIDVITDLHSINQGELDEAIEDLEAIIGATVVSEADKDTPVVSGINV